jgi:hypothetical protein
MYRRHLLLALATAGALCASLPAAARQDPHARQEIAHLLDFVGRSGCQFERNGSWHDGAEARAHIERKYRYLLRKQLVGTTEDFIALAASKSSVSGEPYQVKCGTQQVASGRWMADQLKQLRANAKR